MQDRLGNILEIGDIVYHILHKMYGRIESDQPYRVYPAVRVSEKDKTLLTWNLSNIELAPIEISMLWKLENL